MFTYILSKSCNSFYKFALHSKCYMFVYSPLLVLSLLLALKVQYFLFHY